MKKTNLLYFLIFMVLFGSCQSEAVKDALGETESNTNIELKFDEGSVTTRASNIVWSSPRIGIGDKMGSFVKYNNTIDGPDFYTIKTMNGNFTFYEDISFKDPLALHTFYFYYPYNPIDTDPKKIKTVAIPGIQYQNGTSSAHLKGFENFISSPASAYPGEKLYPNLYSLNSSLNFKINTNIDGLIVENIKFTAPTGKIVTYQGGIVDITKDRSNATFGEISNMVNPENSVTLNINGGLTIPNSTTTQADAYVAIHPFNAYNEEIKVEVKTNKSNTPYTFNITGDWYLANLQYQIELRIEEDKPIHKIKDIYVLSMCDVGCLGLYDNSKAWNCHYGATCQAVHTKAIRRILMEHFGPGKTVNTGRIYFEEAGHNKCCIGKNLDYNSLTEAQLERYNIIFVNKDTRLTAAAAQRIMNWKDKSKDRVLMLAYDWKDYRINQASTESEVLNRVSTNYLLFKNHIQGVSPYWFNGKTEISAGNMGAERSCMLVPFELNHKTTYFWQEGPFKTTLTLGADQRYWISDKYWGAAKVTDPDVIPLVTYRDARNDCSPAKIHSKGAGDGGMILGVDPQKRIVYIGDSQLFSAECVIGSAKQNARIPFNSCKPLEMNNYAKIMANIWAWMIDEVIQKN